MEKKKTLVDIIEPTHLCIQFYFLLTLREKFGDLTDTLIFRKLGKKRQSDVYLAVTCAVIQMSLIKDTDEKIIFNTL